MSKPDVSPQIAISLEHYGAADDIDNSRVMTVPIRLNPVSGVLAMPSNVVGIYVNSPSLSWNFSSRGTPWSGPGFYP